MSEVTKLIEELRRSMAGVRDAEERLSRAIGEQWSEDFRKCFDGETSGRLRGELKRALAIMDDSGAELEKLRAADETELEFERLLELRAMIASREYHLLQLLESSDALSGEVLGGSVASIEAEYKRLRERLSGKATDQAAFDRITGLRRYDARHGNGSRIASGYSVGQTVTLGSYGGEPVEWLVLAADGDKRTLIAVKGQDAVRFNRNREDGNRWERSYIRTWLNDTFYNAAFSAEEQAAITAGPTGDRVWLLSVEEARRYFADDDARVCRPTAYAKSKGAYTDENGAGWWWLRSPGSDALSVARVFWDGVVSWSGSYAYDCEAVVRPVVVVTLGRLEAIAGSEVQVTRRNGSARKASKLAVGSTVTLGSYGGEPVEWLVLAAEGDKRTLIAVKGQDAVCFNRSRSGGNEWERSHIRTWLNDTFYYTAFSAEEQAMITAGSTGDKVWLLSVEEAKKYFTNKAARVCCPTAYANKLGALTNGDGAGWWWLRSPGSASDLAAFVNYNGHVYSRGYFVNYDYAMARPVVVVAPGLFNEI